MQALKLPQFDARIEGESIFCLIRKKWLVLTPEEWVRQHFLNLMIHHLHYPKGMIKLEHGLHYFKNTKRSDIVLLNRDTGIFMVVECKAPSVSIDQKVISQVSEYNKVLNGTFMAVTNGLNHFIWKFGQDGYEQEDRFPDYL